MKAPVTIGVVGLGRRGRRLLNALDTLTQVEVRWLCDVDAESRRSLRLHDGETRVTAEIDDLLGDDALDALVIAVPVEGRRRLVARALEADKHVLAEAPIALTVREADELLRRAERTDRVLMPADVLPLHPGVVELKQMLRRGRLGDLYYLHVSRQVPPGSEARDDAFWDLVAADVSAALHLVDDEPIELFASADSFVHPESPEIIFSHMRFATGVVLQLQLSLLDARPIHQIVVVGSRRTATFDELEWTRMLAVFERSQALADAGALEDEVGYSPGGGVIFPRLAWRDPARLLCDSFLSSVRAPRRRLRIAHNRARAVVSVVETLRRLLADGGSPVAALEYGPETNVTELPLGQRLGRA
ncbi:MAG: Gfo/Idh/MocA family protein [Gaiellaceae bacterium]